VTTFSAATGKTAHSPIDSAAEAPPSPIPQADNRQLLVWMFRFIRPVTALAAISCLYVALGVGAEVMTARQVGRATDQIKNLHFAAGAISRPAGFWSWIRSAETQAVTLRQSVAILFFLVVIMSLLRYLREVANMKFSMNMVYYIREAVYDKIQRVGFGFHDALSSGTIINRALTDLQNVRAFVQTALLITLEIVLVVGGYIVLLMTLNPYIAVLSVLPLPIWVWYILRFSRTVQPAARAVMEEGDRNVALITENIAGVHVIKAFATEQQEILKYGQNCDEFYRKVLYRIRLFANFNPVIRGIATATNLSLILAASVLVLFRKLTAGDILVVQASMQAILGRLQAVSQISDQYQSAIVSSRRLYEVLMADPNVPETGQARLLPPGRGDVRFENLSFGYDAAKPVLRNINLRVPGGSVVAIVGPTGAGKTTLVNLIARFYDPQQGCILIDGVDLRNVRLDSLRKEVAFVFQETYLFSDTIEANIAYGRPHITGGEVEAAARLAQAHEFIETLPAGYQTILRERGSSLSGGQRQRLAIARAILTNPRILVLDDATAAVDPETEGLIRKGMKFAMYGRTTFVIAHRLSTVRVADTVIVMQQGKITQVGTHAELMQQDGHYRDIAAAQLHGEEALMEESPSHMDRIQSGREFEQAEKANVDTSSVVMGHDEPGAPQT
jgi:ABC-type multidrug transport system fused ATPase/permease subunit